jgi:hypothetical protein
VAEPAPTVAAPDSTEPAPTAAASAGSEVAATSEPTSAEAKPADSAPADPNKSEGPSATAAMLAAANTPSPAPAASTPASAEPNAPAGTVVAAIPAGGSGAPGAAVPAPAAAPAPPAEVPPPPGAGDAAAKGKKADFHSHYGAVTAFLEALKAKDPVLLREATALRAPTEAKPKNQPLFTAILEQSLSEDELTELASKLEGFQIVDANQAKSTGRFSYILMKPGKNGSRLVRTITARHEKKGWKVVDISGQGELEKPLLIPRMGGTGGRHR